MTGQALMVAVFLDRDGVIIEKAAEGEYVTDWGRVRFLPGAVASVSTLFKAGFKIVIVTNQRGVALGKIDLEHLDDIHRRMKVTFDRHGACITGIYFCPHDKWERCSCRKPAPGMLLKAAADHGLDLNGSWMVGDAISDIEAGKRAGCRTILIKPCREGEEVADSGLVAADLSSAARLILESAQLRPQH